ncbi:MAG TPA: hypothetical protein VMT18_05005 [Planctomycetota bacterium]|nr:hypothetical protein [Planctomycetota bacterium]
MSRSLCIGTYFTTSALFLVAPLFAAQERGTDKPVDKPAVQAERKTTPASAAAQQKVSLPVTGLTAENAEKVQTSLAALSHTLWTCAECKLTSDEEGQCPHCKKDLASAPHKSLTNVRADAAGGTITAMLNPGAMVKLSEVERALKSASVALDPAKLTLTGHTKLIVQGPGDEAGARKLEQGLKAAKLFDSMEIEHEADSREYVIAVQSSSNAPTKAAAASAITRAGGEGFKLVDVVWIAPQRPS